MFQMCLGVIIAAMLRPGAGVSLIVQDEALTFVKRFYNRTMHPEP